MFFIDYIELPWHCGDSDCETGWHLSLYDMDESGDIYVCSHGDGDWDLSDRAFLPTPEEIDAAWIDYYRDVFYTGKDPLGQFSIGADKIRSKWRVKLTEGTNYLQVLNVARETGSWFDPADAPAEVQDFLSLRRAGHNTYVTHGVTEYEQIKNAQYVSTILRIGHWPNQARVYEFEVSEEINRSEAFIRSCITTKAREWLEKNDPTV